MLATRRDKKMETRFYQTQDIDLQRIAELVVLEYQAQGFEAQRGGTPEQVLVQLKKESTLRAITGFNKALAVTLQKLQGGTLVKVGAQDWVDQIAVGAIGLALHPLLITAGIGALTQYDVVVKLLSYIDQQIRQQQPSATLAVPPVTA
jgi:hypothetical protein